MVNNCRKLFQIGKIVSFSRSHAASMRIFTHSRCTRRKCMKKARLRDGQAGNDGTMNPQKVTVRGLEVKEQNCAAASSMQNSAKLGLAGS